MITGVDRGDLNLGIGAEESRGEAAIAVAEDESVGEIEGLRQEGVPGFRKPGTEGAVFHPAIEAGEAIEVRRSADRM